MTSVVIKIIKICSLHGLSWPYSGKGVNSLCHALFGNKKIGYKVATWNCRRGLLEADGSQSSEVEDINHYLTKHQLHIFGLLRLIFTVLYQG